VEQVQEDHILTELRITHGPEGLVRVTAV
jgi:hypothetical protein